MKHLFSMLVLILTVSCADAQYRKPVKVHPKPAPATRVQLAVPFQMPPNPYVQQAQAYNLAQYQLYLQFMFEQQRLAYLQQLEWQRRQLWLQQQGYYYP